jgi:glucose/mannose transport system substrate-binding protein
MKKYLSIAILLALLIAVVPASFVAAAPPAQGEDYIVQADDSLSKLADKFFGDLNGYWAIMQATNQANGGDPSYAKITNPDAIEVGDKLSMPAKEAAEAFMANFDPAMFKIGDLFASGEAGQLVVGSWWTAGGEAEGLAGMLKIYGETYPNVEIVNATVAGGAGTNFKAQLATRLVGGAPPDTFQLHAGLEVETYSPAQFLQPVDDIYASEGLEQAFPADLLQLLKYEDHYWGVPANIHRSNVLWYNKAVFEANGVTPPADFAEFVAVADKLQAAGIQPFVLGTKDGWEAAHIFETVLAGTLGAEAYRGLWTGATSWEDAGVAQALENFNTMLSYANADHPALTWDGAGEYLINGKGGMMIMGDWTDGWFTSKEFGGYGWAPSPGTGGTFVALSDSFALPKDAPNMENSQNWLKVVGSKAGQEAFNPAKGSICARVDCDPALFNEYLQSAMVDWSQDAIVPSLAHGAAAKESWVTDYKDVVTLFVASGDVASAQAGFQQACVDAGVCQ